MNHRPALNKALTTLFALPLILFSFSGQHAANGQEFRIESQVYSADSNLPVSQNITLFSERLVYDFQLSNDAQPKPVEIIVFDMRKRMIVLLDVERKVRMEIPELQLLKILDGVRRETIQDNRSSFLVEDSFEEDIDWSTNWLTLTSPQIEYRVKGARPKDAAVLPQYNDFLDIFTMLIASNPTQIPPFARIRLNQSIKQHGWIPTEVQISAKQNGLFRHPFNAKSTHVVIHQLSDNDRTRIETAKKHWMQFRRIELAEYRGLKKPSKFKIPVIATASYEETADKGSLQSTDRKR